MYGIDLIAGHNDCYWNFEGRCTFDKYKKHRRSGQRDHGSNENCTLTQVGVQLCSWYEKSHNPIMTVISTINTPLFTQTQFNRSFGTCTQTESKIA